MTKPVTIGPHRDTPLLWLRRSVARYTDGGPRLSGLVVVGLVDGDGWRVTEGLPLDERHRRLQDIMCKCGFAKCSGKGPCAPVAAAGAKAVVRGICRRTECTSMCEGTEATDAEVRADAVRKRWVAAGSLTAASHAGVGCSTAPAVSNLEGELHAHCIKCFKDHGSYSTVSHRRDAERCCAPVDVPRPFNVGDNVRVVASLNRGWPVGRMGTVGDIDSGGFLRIDIGGNSNFHPPHELEHVT